MNTFDVFFIEISLLLERIFHQWFAVHNNMITEVLDILSLTGTTESCKLN
jgi:hypothetical protein